MKGLFLQDIFQTSVLTLVSSKLFLHQNVHLQQKLLVPFIPLACYLANHLKNFIVQAVHHSMLLLEQLPVKLPPQVINGLHLLVITPQQLEHRHNYPKKLLSLPF